MRWSHLSASPDDPIPAGGDPRTDRAAPAAPPLPLALPPVLTGATTRTFDTPGFAGMTFYEIRAKSLINRVPGASRVPFRWTVNPYRGCSHACVYCLAGDTPILLADGSARPLAEVRPGDTVLGTTGDGPDRRYMPTTVLDHWSTTRPAFRVTLADGTRLVAGGDHRFLTDRGWRHVSPGEPHLPALAVGDLLCGVGGFAEPPKETAEYRTGFLCGLIRGDAGGSPGGARDGDAWVRADAWLADHPLHEALRWPDHPTTGWSQGFLAGAYGAAGQADGLAVTFTGTDQRFLSRVTEALTHLGLPSRTLVRTRPGGAATVALDPDLWTGLRFRHLTAASDAPLDAAGAEVRPERRLAVADIEDLGLALPLFDLTTGTGDFVADGVISHNCFARNTHTYLDLDAGHDFDSKVVVKVNAGDLIRRELAAPRWTGEAIAMGTNVDVYQRAEGRYRLMREILAALRDHANPFSILTKGTLILRDVDLLRQAAEVTRVSLSVSVGFVDETVWRAVEPGTPSPRRRLDVVRRLTDAGFDVSVLMAPILPGLTDTDESIDATVAAIAAAGAKSATPLPLHLRPGAREWYAAWLTRTHPELAPRHRDLYGTGAYAPQTYQREVGARVRQATRRHGIHHTDPFQARATQPTPDIQPTQATQPAQTTRPAQAAQPARATRPAQAAQPARAAQPAQAAQPARDTQPAQTAQPARGTQPARTTHAAESAKGAKSIKGVEVTEVSKGAQDTEGAKGTHDPGLTWGAARSGTAVSPRGATGVEQPALFALPS